MHSNIFRAVSGILFSMTVLVAGNASAEYVCETTNECYEVCTINKKGNLKCNLVCEPVTECYEDGNGSGGTGGVEYCFTDALSGEIVCLLQ